MRKVWLHGSAMLLAAGAVLAPVVVGGPGDAARVRADEPAAGVDYERDVQPILAAKCHRCHSAKKRDGKLNMTTREGLLAGGVSGPALVPGKPEKSLMFDLVDFGEMPPKKAQPRVSKEELKTIAAWIAAGAEMPAGGK
jgi:mono/diheme cytochrome c family protein